MKMIKKLQIALNKGSKKVKQKMIRMTLKLELQFNK